MTHVNFLERYVVLADARCVERSAVPIAVCGDAASDKKIGSGTVVQRLRIVNGYRREQSLHDRYAIAADRSDDSLNAGVGVPRIGVTVSAVPVVVTVLVRLHDEQIVAPIAA